MGKNLLFGNVGWCVLLYDVLMYIIVDEMLNRLIVDPDGRDSMFKVEWCWMQIVVETRFVELLILDQQHLLGY